MAERDTSWIKSAYVEAENQSAKNSVREVARLEKCGCHACRQEIQKIYADWARWGKFNPNTRQNTDRRLTVIKK